MLLKYCALVKVTRRPFGAAFLLVENKRVRALGAPPISTLGYATAVS